MRINGASGPPKKKKKGGRSQAAQVTGGRSSAGLKRQMPSKVKTAPVARKRTPVGKPVGGDSVSRGRHSSGRRRVQKR